MNREEWLTELAKKCEDLFDESVPPYKVSCSWPSRSATSAKNRRIGECWHPDASEGKVSEIMISMGIDDPVEVASTLVHELVHAIVGTEHGHKAPFKRCAVAIGLEGKMTATTANKELQDRLNAFMESMPPYPHARLNVTKSGKKKQGTRLLKAICECGYTVRVTRAWAEIGLPICPQCNVALELA